MKSEAIAPSTISAIVPQPGFIVCTPFKEKKVGGFLISDNAAARTSYGEIIAVGAPYSYQEGPQTIQVTIPFKVGDIVIYKNFGDNKIQTSDAGSDLIFLMYHPEPIHTQIMGVVKNG